MARTEKQNRMGDGDMMPLGAGTDVVKSFSKEQGSLAVIPPKIPMSALKDIAHQIVTEPSQSKKHPPHIPLFPLLPPS